MTAFVSTPGRFGATLLRDLALAGVLAISFSGCFGMWSKVDGALAPVGGWSKPGVSEAERRRDQERCDEAALKAHGPGGEARLAYEQCMRATGYELTAK